MFIGFLKWNILGIIFDTLWALNVLELLSHPFSRWGISIDLSLMHALCRFRLGYPQFC